MYSDKVMDHFEHPRNVGEIENASGVGTVGNAKCGDIMRIYFCLLYTSQPDLEDGAEKGRQAAGKGQRIREQGEDPQG